MRFLLALALVASALVAQTPPPAADDVAELNRRGVAASRAGRYAEAVRLFEEAVTARQIDKKAVEPVLIDNLVRSLVGRAAKELEADDLQGARDTLHRARSYRPRDPEALAWTGILAFRVGRANTALEFLLAAVQENDRTVIAHEYLGHVYYDRENLEKALASWKRAVDLAPSRRPFLAAPIEKAARELRVEAGMRIERSTHFVCKFGDEHARAITGEILEWLEEAYTELGGQLHHFPRKSLTVVLYSDRSFNVITRGHEWAAALYDGKIRIPVKNFRASKRELKKTLRHEYSHFLVRSITPECPAWINEGLAQLAEGEAARAIRSRLAKLNREDTLIPVDELVDTFAGISDRDRVWLAYAQALSFVTYLRDEHGGMSRIEEYLRALATEDDHDAAFYRVYRRPLPDFVKRWRESL